MVFFAGAPARAPAAAPAKKTKRYNLGQPDYDPWKDDELTVVTFMVDGVPKKYRIMM